VISKAPPVSESRRQEARRQRDERRETFWRNLRRHARLSSVVIGIVFYAGVLAVQFWGSETMPYSLAQQVYRDINARVSFSYEDQAATEEKRQKASDASPSVFVRDASTSSADPLTVIRDQMLEFRDRAAKASGAEDKQVNEQAPVKDVPLDDAAIAALRAFASDARRSDYERMVDRVLGRLLIVNRPEDPNRKTMPPQVILQTKDKSGHVTSLTADARRLIYLPKSKEDKLEDDIVAALGDVPSCPEALYKPFSTLVMRAVAGPSPEKPSYTPFWQYNAKLTADEMDKAADRVRPEMISYKAGMTLVRAETVLGTTELNLLKREHEEYLKAQRADPVLRQRMLLRQLGTAIVVLLAVIGLAVYTVSYRPRITVVPSRSLALAALLLLMIVLSRLVDRFQGLGSDLPAEACVFFIVITSALLAIAYDQRFAFGVAAVLTVLITVTVNGDFSLLLTYMTAAGVTICLLKEIRTRSRIIAAGGAAALATALVSSATSLMAEQQWLYVITHGAFAGGMALFAGFIVQGILPQFERLFGVATSMTLLEWCDASKPLLRRLAQETPGTYSHSLVLSQMAEEACEAIGARGLLARVGALYHDIGKAQKPEYFVENQEARMNRHDRLSPTLSLLIIVGHIKDGIEMARAYGVPRVLHQFINEHHGTTVVRYFHHMASEAAAKSRLKGKHDREVPESEFRYPGPKPRSKESAILMLCDACEGAVRALSEPTPGRVESTVHQVVMDRLNDGQFDDCEISLRELRQVEQSIVKSLCAIHHGRIKYPKAFTLTPPSKAGVAGQESSEGGEQDTGSEIQEVARQA